ncbi:alpha-N-acetyl-neuraminyl-2,3-beta-galactosyl-1,3-N-acetyl-galactosaminide alpha-2,6-sialyltransferase-like [Saccoglossus kowalevskii]
MGKGRTYGQLMNIVKNNPDIAVYSLTEREMDFVELLFERETGKSRHGSGSWISTGFYSLVLAFHLCDEIHMYGMVSPQHCQNPQTADNDTIPFHYYDPNGLDECTMYKSQEYKMMGGHRYITEKEVFQKWKERRNITFHYPSW